ncbi:hypothetical protein [Polyangium jinanense]|uniref:Uncharacterized protein n=1 Tax=Polyangium jinanense TaxID=2829994 RepID=A0A9X3X5U9_9BACT|nr:hypothetical protein [Polyangium jinanense]MDC3954043.1 hypothetical protein [Polyangium jinanense]MDC3982001.1 hypothetical protein [Polyangium jinanense]
MLRRFHIAEPCSERWESMTGSEARRHCSSCDKQVVALAELSPEEADRLIASARPHSLCVRVEHDEEGNVLFREREPRPPPARSLPRLRLAVGASLLVAACGKHEPAPTATNEIAQPEAAEAQAPRAPAEAQTPPEAEAQPKTSPDQPTGLNPQQRKHNATSVPGKPNTRVTTGCACAIGDPVCSCL